MLHGLNDIHDGIGNIFHLGDKVLIIGKNKKLSLGHAWQLAGNEIQIKETGEWVKTRKVLVKPESYKLCEEDK